MSQKMSNQPEEACSFWECLDHEYNMMDRQNQKMKSKKATKVNIIPKNNESFKFRLECI